MSVSLTKGTEMPKTKSAGLEALKVTLLVLIAGAIGFAVFYCTTKVGDLHSRSAALQSCYDSQHAGNEPSTGCPPNVSKAQIKSPLDEADTLGTLGWVCFFIDVFVVGGVVLDILAD